MKVADPPQGQAQGQPQGPPQGDVLPPDGPPSSWLRRHGLALFLGLLATFAGVVILVEVGPSGLVGFAPRAKVVAVPGSQSGFDKVVDHIYAVTNQAFQQRRVDLLDEVYAANCQCYAQAKGYIEQLLAQHQVLGGAGTQVVSVEVLKLGPGTALLRVRDKVDPFPVYNEKGDVVLREPGRKTTPFTFVLEQRNGTWVLHDVVAQQGSLP